MLHGTRISGVGVYLPEEVRSNDFWPPEVVATWRKKPGIVERLHDNVDQKAEHVHPILQEEMAKLGTDTFRGFKDRRVAPKDMLPSEMEIRAAKEALEDSGVRPEKIDLVMTFSLPPDHFNIPTAFKVAHELKLHNAMAFTLNAICNSSIAMVDVARQFIATGRYEHVLVIVSTKYSDIMDYTSSMSIWAGDSAAAFVLSRCEEGEGVLSVVQKADGSYHDSILILEREPTLPPKRVYDFGPQERSQRYFMTGHDPAKGAHLIARLACWIAEDCKEALSASGMTPNDVGLLVTNAAAPWYSPFVARLLEIPYGRVEDHVVEFGNMGAVNLPVNLYMAKKKGRVKKGDVVLMCGHGGGASHGAIVVRWA